MERGTQSGVTPTEQSLAALCARSFLGLWSYANPYKDDGHEFCDVLAVFEKHVFIFFDREKQLDDFSDNENPEIRWERWKRNTVDRQIKTADGAERYLRSGRKIYLDAKRTTEFPVPVNTASMIVHKIIIAHGAAQACKNFSDSNVYGSLAISYGSTDSPLSWPFMVHLDRGNPVHLFDTHNLPIILGELDTIKDFSDYLDAKSQAIATYEMLSYCGEEDLLAHYLLNFDSVKKRHYIGTINPTINAIMIGEGEWRDFTTLPLYTETKKANRASYLWDRLIQKTTEHWRSGTLLGDGRLLSGRGAIHEMAKEPRFMRRESSERILNAINAFPEKRNELNRHMCFFNSYYPSTGYVVLQLWVPPNIRGDEETYRSKRQEILLTACGVAKNRHPHLKIVVGIGFPPPKLERDFGEDFVWLDCDEWPDDRRSEFEEANADWKFFETGIRHEKTIYEFKQPLRPSGPPVAKRKKTKNWRNELCSCGSGKEFKNCHGR